MTPYHATIRYVIGIDGGGTGTRARLTRANGEVLGFAEAGPSALGQGVQQAWKNVSQAIEGSFHAANVHAWQPAECAVGLGLAGAIVPKHNRDFMQVANRFGEIELANDGYTALLGAHGGGPGAIVAAGTGSIGEALRDDGEHVSVGGWGYPVGDEGSGAWLGMCAMREAQLASDGRGPAGPLVHAIRAVAGNSREALLAWCERDTRSAEWLNDAARATDGIVLALDPDGRLPLVVTGSIGQRLQRRLAPSIRARLVEPAGDAVDGALHLIRARLEETGRRFDGR